MSYIERLTNQMKQMDYTTDYINLVIAYAERLSENKVPIIFDFEHLILIVGNQKRVMNITTYKSSIYYTQMKIPKNNTGFRILNIPNQWLKDIQKWILKDILYSINISDYAKGFRRHNSTLDNANPHTNQKCIINIDISDFFTSIKTLQVYKVFRYLGYTKQVSSHLTSLCTVYGYLPQGAPTSPYLSNIICKRLDKRLSVLLNEYGYNYSRYADDMTFSGDERIVNLISLIYKIINDEGFKVNKKKTRVQLDYQRQTVTGLVVNSQVSIPRTFIKRLRQEIYYCKKFGVSGHMRSQGITKSNYKDHLYGKAYYIKMAHEDKGIHFIKELDDIDWEY